MEHFESFVLVVERYLDTNVFRPANYSFDNYMRLYEYINEIRNNVAMTRQELVNRWLLPLPQPVSQDVFRVRHPVHD